MNFAVILAPKFPLQALRRADASLANRPFATTEGEGRQARIVEASEQAMGVEPGLAVTLALSRCPGLSLRPRDPDAEGEVTRLLLAAAFTLAPRVELTSDGCCTVDLQGAESAQTETRMRHAVDELAQAGIHARIGAGATPLLASYAARCAEPVLAVRETKDFLAPLPVHFAEPTAEQTLILAGWGVTTLGQLTALSKAEVGERLGTGGVQLWERAAGESERVLRLIEPARTFGADWVYEPPVESVEPLLFRLRRFAERVAFELRGAGRVAEKLALTLFLENDTEHHREFRLPEPGANVDTWMRVLQSHLETLKTEACLIGVKLVATPARPPERQDGLFDSALKDPMAFWENLARIAAILGDERVGTPELRDSWHPDAFAMTRPLEVVPAPESDPLHPPRGLTLRRFRPPWRATVALEHERPVHVASEHVNDQVRDTRGPLHLCGRWWKAEASWAFEIWHVELAGGATYQLARTTEGWWVEGVLD
jgi:protein ImuB